MLQNDFADSKQTLQVFHHNSLFTLQGASQPASA